MDDHLICDRAHHQHRNGKFMEYHARDQVRRRKILIYEVIAPVMRNVIASSALIMPVIVLNTSRFLSLHFITPVISLEMMFLRQRFHHGPYHVRDEIRDDLHARCGCFVCAVIWL